MAAQDNMCVITRMDQLQGESILEIMYKQIFKNQQLI